MKNILPAEVEPSGREPGRYRGRTAPVPRKGVPEKGAGSLTQPTREQSSKPGQESATGPGEINRGFGPSSPKTAPKPCAPCWVESGGGGEGGGGLSPAWRWRLGGVLEKPRRSLGEVSAAWRWSLPRPGGGDIPRPGQEVESPRARG